MRTKLDLPELTVKLLEEIADSKSESVDRVVHRYLREFLDPPETGPMGGRLVAQTGGQTLSLFAQALMLEQRGTVKNRDRELVWKNARVGDFTPKEATPEAPGTEVLLGTYLLSRLPKSLAYAHLTMTAEEAKQSDWSDWLSWSRVFLTAKAAQDKDRLDAEAAKKEEQALFPEKEKAK